MHKDTATVLNRILARQMRSLLQYVRHASPWVPPEEESILTRLHALTLEEEQACKRLADLIVRRRHVPDMGVFPQDFCTTHFLALDRLLPWLDRYQVWMIQELEKDLAELDDAEARPVIEELLAMTRRHETELAALAKEYAGKTVSTVR